MLNCEWFPRRGFGSVGAAPTLGTNSARTACAIAGRLHAARREGSALCVAAKLSEADGRGLEERNQTCGGENQNQISG